MRYNKKACFSRRLGTAWLGSYNPRCHMWKEGKWDYVVATNLRIRKLAF